MAFRGLFCFNLDAKRRKWEKHVLTKSHSDLFIPMATQKSIVPNRNNSAFQISTDYNLSSQQRNSDESDKDTNPRYAIRNNLGLLYLTFVLDLTGMQTLHCRIILLFWKYYTEEDSDSRFLNCSFWMIYTCIQHTYNEKLKSFRGTSIIYAQQHRPFSIFFYTVPNNTTLNEITELLTANPKQRQRFYLGTAQENRNRTVTVKLETSSHAEILVFILKVTC